MTLHPADLVPTSVYTRIRTRVREEMVELKRDRRVQIGSDWLLVFENEQTVRYQVQEVVSLSGASGATLQAELEDYAPLLSDRPRLLVATLLFQAQDAGAGDRLRRLEGTLGQLHMRLGSRAVPAHALSDEDRYGAVRFVGFELPDWRDLPARLRAGSGCEIGAPDSAHTVGLPSETGQALAADLEARDVLGRSRDVRSPASLSVSA
jgi:hypothetical protein